MRKGITPIIAVIILLLITVALAGMAWTFLSGYFTGMTAKNIQLIDYSCTNGQTRVIMRNAGTDTIGIGTGASACTNANIITGANTFTCGDITIIKTAGNPANLANGELIFPTGVTSFSVGQTVTFTEDCPAATSCSYRFITTTGAAGPTPNTATVSC